MADIRSLGGNGIDVDFLDVTKYEIPVSSETETLSYDVVQAPVRGSTEINLGLSDPTVRELSFEVWIRGTSWGATLANYDAIRAQVQAAAVYSMGLGGSQCIYTEASGDAGAIQRNVVRGEVFEVRARRLVAMLRLVARVKLVMEPDSAD